MAGSPYPARCPQRNNFTRPVRGKSSPRGWAGRVGAGPGHDVHGYAGVLTPLARAAAIGP